MILCRHHIKFTAPLALAIAALPFSIALCHYALIALGIVWAADGKWKEKWSTIRTNPLVAVFLIFFMLHLAGIIYSEDKQAAWFAIEKKIPLLVLPVLLASIRLEKEEVVQLLHLFLFACLMATLICLWAALHKVYLLSPTVNFGSYNSETFYSFHAEAPRLWMLISYSELASGIGMHPAYLSLYLTFCMLVIIHLYADSFVTCTVGRKAIVLALLFYLIAFVLFLSTRITILAVLIVSLYGLSRFLKSAPRLVFPVGSLALVALFVSIIYVNPVSRFRGYQELVTTWPYLKPGLQTQSTTIRASLWSLSLQSLPKINWMLGAGTGDVEHLLAEAAEAANITNVLGTNDPHNQYLQTLLGLGMVGLFTLLACLIWPAWVAYQTGIPLYVGFIFIFSILCLTETAMELQKGIVFYSLFGSLVLFQYKPQVLGSVNPAIA
jgi:O-antigen ligase